MLLFTRDVNQPDAVLQADLVQHLAQIRGCRGVHARRVAFNIAGGMLAVTTGLSGVPEIFAVARSAPPNISPRSEGLIGDASTRTTTSSDFGSGIGTLVSESSTMPSFVTVERNCSPIG